MFLSKFTICFLAAFALFSFVSARATTPHHKNELAPAIHDANVERLESDITQLCGSCYKAAIKFVVNNLKINGYKIRYILACGNGYETKYNTYIRYQTYKMKFLTYQDRVYTCDFEVHYVYQSKSFKIVHHDCILNGGPLVNEKETTKK